MCFSLKLDLVPEDGLMQVLPLCVEHLHRRLAGDLFAQGKALIVCSVLHAQIFPESKLCGRSWLGLQHCCSSPEE